MQTLSPLIQVMEANFASQAQRTCLEVEDRSLTYSRMDAASRGAAQALAKLGLGPGSRVGLWSEGPAMGFFVALAALLRMGAVPVPLGSKNTPEHIARIKDIAGLTHVVVGDGQTPPVEGLQLIEFSALSGDESWQPPQVGTDDLGALLFTSGSTGAPKGVMLSHRALGGNVLAIGQALGLTPDDRWYFNTPFTFTSAICHFLTCLLAGCTVHADDRFSFPAQTVASINECQATGFAGSPIQIRWFVEALESVSQVPTLKRLMSSGDAMPESTIRHINEKLGGVQYYYVYGMTELGGRFCVCPPQDSLRKLGSVGKPLQGLQAQIRDTETLALLEPGEMGEVFASGEWLMDGYLNQPEKTAQTITEFGLRTGDMGRMDRDGFLYLLGRADNVFKSGGEKISTVLIEKALVALGGFADVAVLGVPDDYLHTVPKVYYVLQPDVEFDRREVLNQLRQTLPDSHLPSLFEEIGAIPRTGSGKVDWPELKQRDA